MALTQVSTNGIKDATIATADIADDAVTAAKINDNQIYSSHIVNGTIVAGDIAADAITGALIADDAVGSEHIEVLDSHLQLADSSIIKLGTGADAYIWHDGSDFYLRNYTGNTVIEAKSNEVGIKVIPDGAIELYHNNVKKFETNSEGIQIHGKTYAEGNIDMPDNAKMLIGNSDDLQIYHDGSHSYISDTGTGDLVIKAQNFNIHAANGTSMAYGVQGAQFELYHGGYKKFETTQYGAKISTNLSAGYLEVLTTGNLGDGHIEIKGGEGGGAVLSLTSDEGDDNEDHWRIQNAGDNRLGFRSKKSGSWVEKLGITDYGDLHPTGHIYMDSGYGINFSDTSDGSGGSNVNEILDDYEEGDFTCRIGGQNNKDTYNQGGNAQYTKIGRLVYVHGYFAGIDIDNNASGQVQIYNLPFTPTFRSYGGAATADVHVSKVNFNTSRKQCWYIGTNGLAGYEARADDSHIDWPVSDFNRASTFIWFSAVYITTT